MDRVEALATGDSDEDSDEGHGLKNAYSVEDLVGELDSDDGGKAPVTQPEIQIGPADKVQSVIPVKSDCSDASKACVSKDGQTFLVSDDMEDVISHVSNQEYKQPPCTGIAPQVTSIADSVDQSTESTDDAVGTCSAADLESSCFDDSVVIDGNYGRTYDEVLKEDIYQNPFEENEGKTTGEAYCLPYLVVKHLESMERIICPIFRLSVVARLLNQLSSWFFSNLKVLGLQLAALTLIIRMIVIACWSMIMVGSCLTEVATRSLELHHYLCSLAYMPYLGEGN